MPGAIACSRDTIRTGVPAGAPLRLGVVQLIRSGARGPEVEDIQRRLTALGLDCGGDEPGHFEAGTLGAVRHFQQRRGLTADGVVGPDTWRALVDAGLRLGDRMLYVTRPPLQGDDVRDLQTRLNRLGFDAGYVDGLYGELTFDAVREFQLNVALKVDGIAGVETIDVLRRLQLGHQQAPAFAVREREQLRVPDRLSPAGARILVDAGHGPDDPGLVGPGGVHEHELTWQLASRLEGRLSARGAHVVLARGPQTTPPASTRAALANREEVELIVSVHLNGLVDEPQARGAAAYYFGQQGYVSERGRLLAQLCVDEVVARTGTPNCRTHPSGQTLLRQSRAPAVLVEPGFLTHPDEGRALTDPGHQALIAEALTDAVVAFLVGTSPTRAAVTTAGAPR